MYQFKNFGMSIALQIEFCFRKQNTVLTEWMRQLSNDGSFLNSEFS